MLSQGCASQGQNNDGIKKQLDSGNISLLSVLDLGRSAYLKGCIDSKNTYAPEKPSAFKKCRELSKLYEEELKEILE